MAPAAIVRTESGSLSIAQPRKTATTGFTYAYVRRQGHRHRANEPRVGREREPRADDDEVDHREHRSERRPADVGQLAGGRSDDHQQSPAHQHLHRRVDEWPLRQRSTARVERSDRPRDPRDEQRDRAEHVDPARPGGPGEQRDSTEADSRPTTVDRDRRCPLAMRSNSAIHSGTAAISNAAMPVSTRVSDQATSELPPTNRNPPTTSAASHCVRPTPVSVRVAAADRTRRRAGRRRSRTGSPWTGRRGSCRSRTGCRGTSNPRRRTRRRGPPRPLPGSGLRSYGS